MSNAHHPADSAADKRSKFDMYMEGTLLDLTAGRLREAASSVTSASDAYNEAARAQQEATEQLRGMRVKLERLEGLQE